MFGFDEQSRNAARPTNQGDTDGCANPRRRLIPVLHVFYRRIRDAEIAIFVVKAEFRVRCNELALLVLGNLRNGAPIMLRLFGANRVHQRWKEKKRCA